MDGYLASLDRLAERPEGLVVPGHGGHLDPAVAAHLSQLAHQGCIAPAFAGGRRH